MLIGHLLCGMMIGALVAIASLWIGFSLPSALAVFVIGANVGLGAIL